jgi:hypothetical protein
MREFEADSHSASVESSFYRFVIGITHKGTHCQGLRRDANTASFAQSGLMHKAEIGFTRSRIDTTRGTSKIAIVFWGTKFEAISISHRLEIRYSACQDRG